MELNLYKRADGLLEAADYETTQQLKHFSAGTYIPCKAQDARSWGNHKRWFKFVSVTFDMQEDYDDKDIWRGVLQIAGGRCKTVVDKQGNTHIWPESISWKELSDEAKFRDMFKRSVSWFLGNYQTKMSDTEFMGIMDFE